MPGATGRPCRQRLQRMEALEQTARSVSAVVHGKLQKSARSVGRLDWHAGASALARNWASQRELGDRAHQALSARLNGQNPAAVLVSRPARRCRRPTASLPPCVRCCAGISRLSVAGPASFAQYTATIDAYLAVLATCRRRPAMWIWRVSCRRISALSAPRNKPAASAPP